MPGNTHKSATQKHGARLGQHFLTRPEIAGWVADAIPLNASDTVLEIGPGHGILTRELLKRAGKVIAIEKDPALVAELQGTFAPELTNGTVTLIEQDIRDLDPYNLQPVMSADRSSRGRTTYHLVANIPYYLTGYILRKFLTAKHQPTALAVLIQKEVAMRIVAKEGKESLLSLSVKAYGEPHIAHVVRAGAFSPPPKVDSAVLAIAHISRDSFVNRDHEEQFFTLLHVAFGAKRKTIGSTLREHFSLNDFASCGLETTKRPEDVSLDTWLALAKCGVRKS